MKLREEVEIKRKVHDQFSRGKKIEGVVLIIVFWAVFFFFVRVKNCGKKGERENMWGVVLVIYAENTRRTCRHIGTREKLRNVSACTIFKVILKKNTRGEKIRVARIKIFTNARVHTRRKKNSTYKKLCADILPFFQEISRFSTPKFSQNVCRRKY